MSEAIAFLECIACSSQPSTNTEYAQAVAAFDGAVHAALMARSAAALTAALGGREKMYCCVWAPDSDEPFPAEQPAVPDDMPETPEQQAA